MIARRQVFETAVAEFEAHWPLLVGVFVFGLALWAQTSAMVGVFFDDGVYVQLAKSLAEGTGYRSMHLPDAPAAVHYPPVYPFLLSLLWRLWPSFPANITLFELVDAAWLGLAATLIALHVRRTALPWHVSAGVLALAFMAFPLLTLVGVRFSEPVFLALAAGALLVSDTDNASVRSAVLAGGLAGVATLTRSIGITVIGGVVLGMWLSGRRRSAIIAGSTAAVLLIPWLVFLVAHRGEVDPLLVSNYGTYGQFAGQAGIVGVLASVDLGALDSLRRLLLPEAPALIAWPLTGLLLAALGAGVWSGFRRSPVLVSTVVLYLGVVTLWPYAPDRFVWIALPWIAILLAMGARHGWSKGSLARWGALLLMAAVAVGYGPREFRSLSTRGFARTASAPSVPFVLLATSISRALPVDAIVATDGEALVYLYSGRRTVPVYMFELEGREAIRFSTDSILTYWCRQGVTHVAASVPDAGLAPLLDDLESLPDVELRTLFEVTAGPRLSEFTCRR